MSKILLIEDREERQKQFIDEANIEFIEYINILDNKVGSDYELIYKNLIDNTIELDKYLSNYSVIISHKSAFNKSDEDNNKIIDKLKDYSKKTDKVLVFFSGGIDANYYEKEKNYKYIELNSKTLYSENFKLFLEDFKVGNLNPLILCYGNRWKLNILLNTLESINLYLSNMGKNKVLYSSFSKENKSINELDSLKLDIYTPIIESNRITKSEINELKNSILKHIERSVKYE